RRERPLRDTRVGADQRQDAERAGGEVELLEGRLQLREKARLRAPHLIADIARQLAEIDGAIGRLGRPGPRGAASGALSGSFHVLGITSARAATAPGSGRRSAAAAAAG